MAPMNQKTFHYIPDTISEQAKEYLSGLVPEDVPARPSNAIPGCLRFMLIMQRDFRQR